MTNGSSDRLDRIERSLEILTQMVSENRADLAVAGARMDALIQTIAESTARSEARINSIEQLIRQNEQRISRLEENR